MGLVGTGFFGAGLTAAVALLDGLEPRIAANRTLDRALAAYPRAGIRSGRVVVAERGGRTASHRPGRYVATPTYFCPRRYAASTSLSTQPATCWWGHAWQSRQSKPASMLSPQIPMFRRLSVQSSRFWPTAPAWSIAILKATNRDLLKGLFDYCTDIGLDVVVAGNGKGILKRYATPATQAAFAAEHGLQRWLATAAADGTKLNFELTVVANATSLVPAVRGMHGPPTDLSLVECFQQLDLLDGGHYVDYVLGGRGVFVVVKSDDPQVHSDFRYLKLGDGQYYLLHRPEVLAHYAAPLSILRAVTLGQASVTPLGAPVAETIAFAKRDLPAGHHVDGIGGFDTYGLIVRADEAHREQLLPVGSRSMLASPGLSSRMRR